MATHFENAARLLPTVSRTSETWIEEAGVMNPKLPDHRVERNHFGRADRRNVHRLAADEDVKSSGIQNDSTLFRIHRLPEFRRVIVIDLAQVDQARVGLDPVTCSQIIVRQKVDREFKAFVNSRSAIDKAIPGMQLREFIIRQD